MLMIQNAHASENTLKYTQILKEIVWLSRIIKGGYLYNK